jgi:3-oxoacyl-[acyl-carrier protein] reductase
LYSTAALEDPREIGSADHRSCPATSRIFRLTSLSRRPKRRWAWSVLVNNARITKDNLFMRMKDDEWDQVLAVNLTAAFHLTRRVAGRRLKAVSAWWHYLGGQAWSAIPARAITPRLPRPG